MIEAEHTGRATNVASWQTHALEVYLRIKRRFSDPSGRLDVARERADVESMASLFRPLCAIECQPIVAHGLAAEWILPEGHRGLPAILYLHGGSFNSGSISSHRTLAGNVAFACKGRAMLLDYRLAPEHPFPAALEDAAATYAWLLDQGYAPHEIVVAGDSAGGTLTLALLIHLRDHHRPLPAAAVCLSPVTDLTFSGESWAFNSKKDLMLDERKERQSVEIYLRGADPRTPLASPYFGDLRGLPPLLIQIGSHELLLSDATRFAEKARQAGVNATLEIWPQMQHEWQFAARILPEGKRAILKIGAFVEAALPGNVGREDSLALG